MADQAKFKDLYTYRAKSVLPEHCQTIVRALGDADRKSESLFISDFRRQTALIDPKFVSRASLEIRDIGQLYPDWLPRRSPWLSLSSRLFGRVNSPLLHRSQHLKAEFDWFWLDHGDGHKREKALRALNTLPISAFEVMTIINRLNDWVPEVRKAALDYAQRTIDAWPNEAVAEASIYLCSKKSPHLRWSRQGRNLIKEMMFRHDVAAQIKDTLLRTANGPVAKLLSASLKEPYLDAHLVELAVSAKSSAVRVRALETLLSGQARWVTGFEKQWIDRTMGWFRMVPIFESRSISVSFDAKTLIEVSSEDKAAKVRACLVSALINHVRPLQSWHRDLALSMQNDKNPGVRSKVDFYSKNSHAERSCRLPIRKHIGAPAFKGRSILSKANH